MSTFIIPAVSSSSMARAMRPKGMVATSYATPLLARLRAPSCRRRATCGSVKARDRHQPLAAASARAALSMVEEQPVVVPRRVGELRAGRRRRPPRTRPPRWCGSASSTGMKPARVSARPRRPRSPGRRCSAGGRRPPAGACRATSLAAVEPHARRRSPLACDADCARAPSASRDALAPRRRPRSAAETSGVLVGQQARSGDSITVTVGAEAPEHLRELAADVAAAEHHEVPRQLAQLHDASRCRARPPRPGRGSAARPARRRR